MVAEGRDGAKAHGKTPLDRRPRAEYTVIRRCNAFTLNGKESTTQHSIQPPLAILGSLPHSLPVQATCNKLASAGLRNEGLCMRFELPCRCCEEPVKMTAARYIALDKAGERPLCAECRRFASLLPTWSDTNEQGESVIGETADDGGQGW
jgi:hypothetical protein